ncbi:ribosomal protein S6 kinase-related protein [Exaiptasia diaphana]|uniref:Protein kinase domain-containing protein n=1 Tax=Exaiptasia diaphana TaxID=2652724 RepID=A0A913XTX4_EXADI|nr:ribosomal protein S6 kinase-related protein [Exaiptasia diaphana]KXJ29369.1 RAC family serine/threonine-protein kinase-like [Exaiptasia diaphana]
MGNTHTRKADESSHRRRRPNSIAIDKPIETLSSETTGKRELRRSASQNSFRRRYTESGNYSYKTPWPAPMSEVVFWPEFESKPPVRFTDFEMLANIGKGAFGHVLQVKKRNTEDVFAMKILNKAEIIKENAIQQCKDEANIQMKINNFPFLVKTWYTWQTKHNLFIVSDFVDGSDLFTLWIQERTLDENLVRLYISELALTLDFLHKCGVVYRDLKLENVLLDKQGHIKIIDFGLSKLMSRNEKTNTICGTLQFMAPEVLKGEKYDYSVDWWALGIVMYVLLVGKYPYVATKDHDSQFKVLEETEFEFPDSLSTASVSLMNQLLQKDPKERLRSLDALKRHPFFKDFVFDDALDKKQVPLDESTFKKLRRRSAAGRTYFPRQVEPRKADRKARALSWASPGNFTIHDKVELDYLVSDLGSFAKIDTVANANTATKTSLTTVGELCTAAS